MEEQLRSETRNMANIFVGLMLVRIYEYFLGEFEYPTLSFISYAVGIVLIVIFNRKHCWSLADFGIRGVINSTWWEVILPSVIWVFSFALIVVPEFLISTFGASEEPFFDFVCFNQHVDLVLSRSDNLILVSWTLIGAVICTLRALFLEVYFRGLCFGVLRKKTNFYTCNIVQSMLFAIWFIVLPVKSLIYGQEHGKTVALMLLFFIAQFLFAFRLGYIRLVCGTVWPCVLSTFIYNMITFNVTMNG
ncbi:MAG: type II CAAX prenyl endopeptidase Rce1 family protein, partial [Acutalibacteraceae bacterium]